MRSGRDRIDLGRILRLDDDPHRIAGGLAVGIFVGCSPFFGFHTILALLLAFLFRLNKLAAVAGSWLVLPWIAPFLLGLSLLLGRWLLGEGIGLPLAGSLDREWIARNFSSLLLGSSLIGAAAAAIAYWIARLAVGRGRKNTPLSFASSPPGGEPPGGSLP